jgi:hypothetical protein
MSLQSCLSHMKLFGMFGSKRVGFFESRILGAFFGFDVGMIKVTIEVGFACVGGGVCAVWIWDQVGFPPCAVFLCLSSSFR